MIEPPVGLGLMCKPPRPGLTKTRLARAIGPVVAARLSRAFLEDCAAAAFDAARLIRLEPIGLYRPADAAGELAAILGPRWPLAYSDLGELGATMLDALQRLLARCPAGAMVMGADVPMIGGAAIADAARTLRDGDERSVAVIPTADGGYCLVGVRSAEAAAPLLAPMAWSTPDVLDETLRRARRNGLKVTVLPLQRDIDEMSDLEWLRQELGCRPDAARATREILARMAGEVADR